jgi:predicted TPR repeat methyltransferase
MSEGDPLKDLDKLGTAEETRSFYDRWAETYDTHVARSGYAAPLRAAAALAAQAPDRTAALLDVGCGTGMSGAALRDAGFTTIDGVDFSEGMLAKAREKGIYRTLFRADLTTEWPFAAGAYPLIAAVGSIGPGHLPAILIDRIVAALPPGGLFVFSFSDRAKRDAEYTGRLNEQCDAGPVEFLFRETGAYLPSENMQADILVFRKR